MNYICTSKKTGLSWTVTEQEMTALKADASVSGKYRFEPIPEPKTEMTTPHGVEKKQPAEPKETAKTNTKTGL